MQNKELRETQITLEASRSRYFDLYDLAPIGYLSVTEGGLIQHANLTAATLLRLPRSELIERPIHRLIFPEDQDAFYLMRRQLLETGEPQSCELRIAVGDGITFWANVSSSVVPHPDGTREFRIVLNDVTAKRKAEESMRVSDAALRGVSQAVLITDPARLIVSANDAFVAITGYPKSEILGRNCNFLQGPETDPETVSAIRQAITNRLQFTGDILNYRKDGTPFWNEVTISPVCDERGRLTHFIGIIRDVSDRRRAATHLVQAKDAAETASRAKSEFLANMSHELRTPLNAIIGMSELLALDPSGPEAKDCIATIHSSGAALLSLISSILDLSKIEAGKFVLDEVPIDLRACVQSALKTLSLDAAAKELALTVTVEPDVPDVIIGDGNRLHQILLNLLANAVKFTARGLVHLHVSRTSRPGVRDLLVISVRDTGIGISAEDIPKLFQVFSQVDASTQRRYGGSGLGLAVNRRLVERMNGRIWAESEPGKGSTFKFEIPLFPAEDAKLAEKPLTAAIVDKSLALRCPLRILVAEDNPVNQRVIALVLKRFGYPATFAANGREALDALAIAPFDLVLMDIQMPVMDGLEAAAEICQRYFDPARPQMIAVTAHALHEDRQACFAAGMQDYISKPLNLERLATAIERAYERRIARQRAGPE